MKRAYGFILSLAIIGSALAQSKEAPKIQDLEFLLGKWEVREDNHEKGWWEESIRIGSYILDSTHIELKASAVSSSGKERTYLWLIHFNFKAQQFEMISMFSNWHKTQFDILSWNPTTRTLTIQSAEDPNSNEYHDRYGELVFNEGLSRYTWKGRNKYGDPDSPSIWNYIEKGTKINK